MAKPSVAVRVARARELDNNLKALMPPDASTTMRNCVLAVCLGVRAAVDDNLKYESDALTFNTADFLNNYVQMATIWMGLNSPKYVVKAIAKYLDDYSVGYVVHNDTFTSIID